MNICSRCRKEFDYYKYKTCDKCRNYAIKKSKEYYYTHKQQSYLSHRNYVKEHKDELKEYHKLYFEKYYNKNKEYINSKNKKYNKDNHEKINEYKLEWEDNNKEKRKEYRIQTQNKRRSLKTIMLFKNPFPDEVKIHYHHINNWFVIPIPEKLHCKTFNGNNVNKHREMCKEIILSLYGLDTNILFESVKELRDESFILRRV